jgi:hypothetical protein
MSIHVLPGDIRVEPPLPVEIPVSVDGKTLRVAIEWPAVARMLPTADQSFDAVATALRGQARDHRNGDPRPPVRAGHPRSTAAFGSRRLTSTRCRDAERVVPLTKPSRGTGLAHGFGAQASLGRSPPVERVRGRRPFFAVVRGNDCVGHSMRLLQLRAQEIASVHR